MKKVMTIFGAIIIASFILTSYGCGKKKAESVTIKPKSTIIKGDLGEYFEVVNKEYTIKVEDPNSYSKEGKIIVEVKRNNKDFAFNIDKLDVFGVHGDVVDYNFGFGIELLTDAGPALVRVATDDNFLPRDECISLMKIKKGETGYLSWNVEQTKFNGLKSFQLTSALQKVEHTTSSNTSSKESSVDCDKFIKDYEAFVNSYIKILKKYKKNPSDVSILTEYTEAAQKAIDMQTDASSCTDAKYVVKLSELANKIARASM